MYGSFRLSADETDGRLLEGLRFYARDVQREAPCVPPIHSCSHHAAICHNDAVVSCRYVWMFVIPFGYMEEVVRRHGDGQANPWTFKPLEWLQSVHEHLCRRSRRFTTLPSDGHQIPPWFLGVQT